MTEQVPVPPDQVRHAANVADAYSTAAEAYARLWSPVIRPMAQPLLAALPLHDAKRVLDVGTGSGGLISDIRSAAPHAALIGVDRAEGMLRVAQAPAANTGASLALMDAQQLGIRDDALDVAVMAFVLFHVPDPHQALAEVARVLRSAGAAGVATWGLEPVFPASALWDEELESVGAGPDPISVGRQDKLMDTPERLRDTLERAGFGGVRAWAHVYEHHWDAEGFFALRSSHGVYRRRLDTLEPELRAACLAHVRDRLDRLTPADFIYRPEVIYAVARKPQA